MATLRLWFGLSLPVDRGTYLRHGAGLMAGKYLVDTAIIRAATGHFWTPLDYLNPSVLSRSVRLPDAPDLLLWGLAAWTLPFVWIGTSMTVRRAIDAGRSPWFGLLFFVPFLNYLLMLGLCLLPSRPRRPAAPGTDDARFAAAFPSAALAVALGVLLALGTAFFGVRLLNTYGSGLFLGAPFLLGVLAGYVHNARHRRPATETVSVVLLAVLLASGAILLFAVEGAVCIAMALPLAIGMAVPGGFLGREMARFTARGSEAAVAALLLPTLLLLEPPPPPEPVRERRSEIVIAASPERVWRHVVGGFQEMPPPSEAVFRLGVAYPVRARLEGRGVGAVRHCEFSTGAFVEPITRWEEPTRLSFEVVDQPPPLREWTPYRQLDPGHLASGFRSVRGEFRLTPLPDGRTRLEASTWYVLDIRPALYWSLYADGLVGTIHDRVLRHIRRLAETPA